MQVLCNVLAACSVVTIGALTLWWYRRNRSQQPPSKWREVGKVGKLLMYPLKSGKRVEIEEAQCGECGMVQVTEKSVLKFRDRFLIICGGDQNNLEIKSAITFPKMVLIEVSNHDLEHVALDAPNMRTLYVKIPKTSQDEVLKIPMHNKEILEIVDCGDEAAEWVSRYIKNVEKGLRLGFHDENFTNRKKSQDFQKSYPNILDNDMATFSDFHFMLMTNASVKELNSRLDKAVTPYQFRPNIIVDNVEVPYVEDDWKWIKIGEDTIFRNIKPCDRCVFITIDTETGIMDSKKEPLTTLKTYRQFEDEEERKASGNSPLMGIFLGIRNKGNIKLNDIVYVGEAPY